MFKKIVLLIFGLGFLLGICSCEEKVTYADHYADLGQYNTFADELFYKYTIEVDAHNTRKYLDFAGGWYGYESLSQTHYTSQYYRLQKSRFVADLSVLNKRLTAKTACFEYHVEIYDVILGQSKLIYQKDTYLNNGHYYNCEKSYFAELDKYAILIEGSLDYQKSATVNLLELDKTLPKNCALYNLYDLKWNVDEYYGGNDPDICLYFNFDRSFNYVCDKVSSTRDSQNLSYYTVLFDQNYELSEIRRNNKVAYQVSTDIIAVLTASKFFKTADCKIEVPADFSLNIDLAADIELNLI